MDSKSHLADKWPIEGPDTRMNQKEAGVRSPLPPTNHLNNWFLQGSCFGAKLLMSKATVFTSACSVSLPTFDSRTPVGVGDTSDSGIDSILSICDTDSWNFMMIESFCDVDLS